MAQLRLIALRYRVIESEIEVNRENETLTDLNLKWITSRAQQESQIWVTIGSIE